MGWRKLSGYLDISADNASEFIEKAFPKTSQWSFKGKYSEKERILEYSLFHHDAPTGESYIVTAQSMN